MNSYWIPLISLVGAFMHVTAGGMDESTAPGTEVKKDIRATTQKPTPKADIKNRDIPSTKAIGKQELEARKALSSEKKTLDEQIRKAEREHGKNSVEAEQAKREARERMAVLREAVRSARQHDRHR